MNWGSIPLGYCVTEVRSKNLNGREQNLLSLSYGNIVRKDIDSAEGLLPESFDTYNVVLAGDTVLRLTDLQNDQRSLRVGLVTERGIITSAYVSLRPSQVMDPRFLNYFLKNLDFQKHFYALGAGVRQSLKFEELRKIDVPMPPLRVQVGIADYLDSETARIDALITKKQRMAALLRLQFESRLAAAFEIKGVPTPALSVTVRIAEGQVDPTLEPFAGMILIAPDHVESGTGRLLDTSSAADQGASSGKYMCEEGDVIYSKIRPSLRKVCIAPERCLTSADMYPMRPRSDLMPQFLRFFLLSDRFSSFAILESERVAMPKINRDAFGRIRIPIPPQQEQRRIVDELEAAQSHLKNLADRLLHQIDLLRERRQALITAAVTGEIEVPGVAA